MRNFLGTYKLTFLLSILLDLKSSFLICEFNESLFEISSSPFIQNTACWYIYKSSRANCYAISFPAPTFPFANLSPLLKFLNCTKMCAFYLRLKCVCVKKPSSLNLLTNSFLPKLGWFITSFEWLEIAWALYLVLTPISFYPKLHLFLELYKS